MTAPFRVLITGSRTWPYPAAVHNRLSELWTGHDWSRPFVVVHGAARGVDSHAADWVRAERRRGLLPEQLLEEPYPITRADWQAPCTDRCETPGHRRRRPDGTDYCPAVGMYRNERMVRAGADLCLAFIHNGSSGATGCANAAEAAGIPTRRYEWPLPAA